ncbi:MAG TPA: helix-turn-helix domain-containing protein [Acidimicrobiales bacterium]|nr:helix-turn-helix domain-containing protein [Acidimicrobiales bacterium]
MSDGVKGPSKKRRNRREVAAAETRREILSTARRLFAEHGYANTSVQQIAEESGVAVQTVYSSVGSKAALVLALNDLIDEEAGVAALAAELFDETDPAQLIAKAVHLTRQLNERCGDIVRVLLSAEPAEPDAAAAVAEGMRRHEQGASRISQRLAGLGALRADMTPERAAAVFSMMTSPASWRQLTQDAGWSYDEGELWLAASLGQLLLNPTAPNKAANASA